MVWLREHRDGVQWFVWAITVSTPLNALVITLLRRLLPTPHRDVYFIGAVTILITNAVQAWTWAGLQPGGAMNLQLGAGLTGAWSLAFALWGGV